MFHSRNFIGQCRRALRGQPKLIPDQLQQIEELTVRHVPGVPRDLARDLFAALTDTPVQSAEEIETLIQTLADMVDLFAQQYDDNADPFGTREWEILRDLVDSYAQELDVEVIQYVMERVVSHKAL